METEGQTSFLEAEKRFGPEPGRAVQSLDTVRERLNHLHDTVGLSWRKIAALDEFTNKDGVGIPPGTLCAIAKGREPKKNEHRRILGLREIIEIKVRRNHKGKFTD